MNIELELWSQMHIWGHTKWGTDIRQTNTHVYRVAPQLKSLLMNSTKMVFDVLTEHIYKQILAGQAIEEN